MLLIVSEYRNPDDQNLDVLQAKKDFNKGNLPHIDISIHNISVNNRPVETIPFQNDEEFKNKKFGFQNKAPVFEHNT